MSIGITVQQILYRFLRFLASLLICCVVLFSWSNPSQASSECVGDQCSLAKPSEKEILQVIRTHPDVILEVLQTYQKQQWQQQQEARLAFLQEMKLNPKVGIKESPITGATNPKVVFLEFSDFQCPYCAEVHKTLKQFIANHKNEVALVYKHTPLSSIHSEALPAAKAAWAAGQQGKFWEYHDALFAQQDKLGEELYQNIAKALTLKLTQFNQDRRSTTAELAIQQDIEMAKSFGVTSTPSFVINGRAFAGNVNLSKFEEILTLIQDSTNES